MSMILIVELSLIYFVQETICLVDEAGKYFPFFPGHIFFSNGTKGWDMISALNPVSETRLRACFGLP